VRNKHTQVQKEVRTLLIRDAAVCVIGVFAGFKIDDQTLILGFIYVIIQSLAQGCRTDDILKTTLCRRVEKLLQ
jgi:hypothetical protein